MDQLLKCPLTGVTMIEPVTLPDGNTYERENVLTFLKTNWIYPASCLPIEEDAILLYPNTIVKRWCFPTKTVDSPDSVILVHRKKDFEILPKAIKQGHERAHELIQRGEERNKQRLSELKELENEIALYTNPT